MKLQEIFESQEKSIPITLRTIGKGMGLTIEVGQKSTSKAGDTYPVSLWVRGKKFTSPDVETTKRFWKEVLAKDIFHNRKISFLLFRADGGDWEEVNGAVLPGEKTLGPGGEPSLAITRIRIQEDNN